MQRENRNVPLLPADRNGLPPFAAALATPSHLRSRDVSLLVHEVQVATLLLDAHLCNFFCHEKSPPLPQCLVITPSPHRVVAMNSILLRANGHRVKDASQRRNGGSDRDLAGLRIRARAALNPTLDATAITPHLKLMDIHLKGWIRHDADACSRSRRATRQCEGCRHIRILRKSRYDRSRGTLEDEHGLRQVLKGKMLATHIGCRGKGAGRLACRQ